MVITVIRLSLTSPAIIRVVFSIVRLFTCTRHCYYTRPIKDVVRSGWPTRYAVLSTVSKLQGWFAYSIQFVRLSCPVLSLTQARKGVPNPKWCKELQVTCTSVLRSKFKAQSEMFCLNNEQYIIPVPVPERTRLMSYIDFSILHFQ